MDFWKVAGVAPPKRLDETLMNKTNNEAKMKEQKKAVLKGKRYDLPKLSDGRYNNAELATKGMVSADMAQYLNVGDEADVYDDKGSKVDGKIVAKTNDTITMLVNGKKIIRKIVE